ncbi:AAA family ATPase [Scytonema sp. NUACC26]|uniref:AAA family ATPase n=1 Tax=Scytonema sp. NUACC26 TaxID=3140176 RepID=UPI0034DB95B3
MDTIKILDTDTESDDYIIFLRRHLNSTHDKVQEAIASQCHQFGKSYEQMDEDFSVVLGEECKRRIRGINDTNDVISKNRKRVALDAWLANFIPDRQLRQQTIITYSIEQSNARFYKLGELIEMSKSMPDTSLIKGLIPLGALILIAASAKVGKSLFITKMLNSVALGQPFLGRNTVRGNVLYIQNEENLVKTTRKRVLTGGIQDLELTDFDLYRKTLWDDKITIAHKIDIALEQELILHKVKELDCKLVLIDALGSSFEKAGLDELSAEVPGHLYRLQRLAQQNDFTIVLVHHANKQGDNNSTQGRMNSIAGRSGITRANDGNFVLSRVEDPQTNESYVQLNTVPRDGDPVTIQYKIVKEEANRWEFSVSKDTVLTPENLELQNKILRVLFERWDKWDKQYNDVDIDERPVPFGYTKNELIGITDSTEEDVKNRLNDMLGSDGIMAYADRSIKQWVYCIHPNGESWLEYYLEQEESIEKRKQEREQQEREQNELENRIFQQTLIEIKEAIDERNLKTVEKILKPLYAEKNKDKYNALRLALTEEENDKLWLVYYPPQYEIGVSVIIIDEDISSTVERIVYDKDKKYHMYYLQNVEGTYRSEQIKLNASDSEINNNGNI